MIRLDTFDTIVAISSPSGPAIRSIVRMTGPDSWRLAARTCTGLPADEPRKAMVWAVESGLTGSAAPISGRVQYWPAGRSYTGQASVEVHLDVPNILAELALRRLVAAGARQAEPGEFTLRAFLAGRMDLTRAEAVAGIFQAMTPERMEVALAQLAGGLGRKVEKLRDRLLDLTAWLEATLDFVEEADVDPISRNLVAEEIRGTRWELGRVVDTGMARDKPVTERRIVLAGRPNAGKSQLFNRLCGPSGRALVSPIAGTTRDYLEGSIDLGEGVVATLVDTAGEELSGETIDELAQALGQRERLLADAYLVCVPVDASVTDFMRFEESLPGGTPRVYVRTKADLAITEPADAGGGEWIAVSATTGFGIDALSLAIRDRLEGREPELGPIVAGTRQRTGDSLRRACEALERAAGTMSAGGGDEIVAIELRTAVEALDVITGRDATEEMLDRIFSRFCIGK